MCSKYLNGRGGSPIVNVITEKPYLLTIRHNLLGLCVGYVKIEILKAIFGKFAIV